MLPRTVVVLTAALALALPASLAAQTKMALRPESKVVLAGSSNVHDWSCKGAEFLAMIELDSTYATEPLNELVQPITKVLVTIPVKSVKCGKAKMDENMYKALRAHEFTDIRYELTTYKIDLATAAVDSFTATSEGQLTVAGQTRRVEIPIVAKRLEGGSMRGQGTLRMRMTDFGIKPPTALLGTLRTKNEIEISFKVLLDKTVVVALLQP